MELEQSGKGKRLALDYLKIEERLTQVVEDSEEGDKLRSMRRNRGSTMGPQCSTSGG
jgi:hypothetical protein